MKTSAMILTYIAPAAMAIASACAGASIGRPARADPPPPAVQAPTVPTVDRTATEIDRTAMAISQADQALHETEPAKAVEAARPAVAEAGRGAAAAKASNQADAEALQRLGNELKNMQLASDQRVAAVQRESEKKQAEIVAEYEQKLTISSAKQVELSKEIDRLKDESAAREKGSLSLLMLVGSVVLVGGLIVAAFGRLVNIGAAWGFSASAIGFCTIVLALAAPKVANGAATAFVIAIYAFVAISILMFVALCISLVHGGGMAKIAEELTETFQRVVGRPDPAQSEIANGVQSPTTKAFVDAWQSANNFSLKK